MLQSKPVENIYPIPDPKNILDWHFIIYGLKDCPYEGGYYYGKLTFPPEYPNKPPSLVFITPNGRFNTEEKICMSFTNYHPESWSTSWTVENMLIGLISFMNTSERTKGSIDTTYSTKRKLAADSIHFNLKHPGFQRVFKPHFAKLGLDEGGMPKYNPVAQQMLQKNQENFQKQLFFTIAGVVLLISYGLYKAMTMK